MTHLEKRARARANLMRQPPEKVLVALICMSELKPSPLSMTEAFAGALSASMFCSCAYTSLRAELASLSAFLQKKNHLSC